ncbi:hypothetical protein LTR22_028057 [Elasticomyces elasticus]|nr:hypothetical protein LTR22_028057 [Elasticomyces elasticus]
MAGQGNYGITKAPGVKYHNQTPPMPAAGLYIVTFKNARAAVFYLAQEMEYPPRTGDIVRVDADNRGGWDIGIIEATKLSVSQAKECLQTHRKLHRERLTALMAEHNRAHVAVSYSVDTPEVSRMTSRRPFPTDVSLNLCDKACIQRPANESEVAWFKTKWEDELWAQELCQDLVDSNHLTIHYHSKHYIKFDKLVNKMFSFYRRRIWLSRVELFSFDYSGLPNQGSITNSETSLPHGPPELADLWIDGTVVGRYLSTPLADHMQFKQMEDSGYAGVGINVLDSSASTSTRLAFRFGNNDHINTPELPHTESTTTSNRYTATADDASTIWDFPTTGLPILRPDDGTTPGTWSSPSNSHQAGRKFELWRTLGNNNLS